MKDGGNQASAKSTSESGSSARACGSAIQPPISIGWSAPTKGIAPTRACITSCLVNSGAPLNMRGVSRRSRSGGATSGIGSASASGASQGSEKAASASAIVAPSWVRRAESVESERPARSMLTSIFAGPGSGELA